MIERAYSRPVVPMLTAFICGLFLGVGIPGYITSAFGFIGLTSVVIITSIVRRRKAAIPPIILFLSLGYMSIQPWVPPLFPPHPVDLLTDSGTHNITGVIGPSIRIFPDRKRLDVHNLKIISGYKKKPLSISGKIRVVVTGDSPDLAAGDTILFSGRIRSLHNFNNPGGFDYRRYMAFQGIWGTTYTQGPKITHLPQRSNQGIDALFSAMRQNIAGFIDTHTRGDANALLKALIIGDRHSISATTRDAFNRSGAGHLLAISGLHIGIVATLAYLLLYRVMSVFRPLLWQAWSRKAAALLCLLPVWFYGLLAGMSPSTQRAVIMVSVFLMTFLLEREQDSLNTLALAALIILIWHPPALFSISFQLSFAAVAAILYGLDCLQRLPSRDTAGKLPSVWMRLKRKLAGAVLVSLLAIGGTLPLVMFYFNQISTVGLITNLITVPLIGFVTVPLGLISIVALPFSEWVASWPLNLSVVVLEATLEVITKFAFLPFAAFKTVTPSVFEIGCYYVLGWAVLNILRRSRLGDYPTVSGTDRIGAEYDPVAEKTVNGQTGHRKSFADIRQACLKNKAVTIAVITLLLITGDIWYWYSIRFLNKDLRITIIDVGQGTAALIELPQGYNMLIDGGGFTDNSRFDIGARVIAPLLWRKKIKTVDTLILSHPNSDHLNGLIYIAKHFNVKNVWSNGERRDTIGYRTFMEMIATEKIQQPRFADISRNTSINGVEFNILSPPVEFLDLRRHQKWRNTNNDSLVVKVNYGLQSFLFPGDLMKSGERELVRVAGEQLGCNVLIAPHHGSQSSSTDPFLDHAQPEVVVISAGWLNPRKFPHPKVSAKYKRRGYQIYCTEQHGAVAMTTDGEYLSIEPTIKQAFQQVGP